MAMAKATAEGFLHYLSLSLSLITGSQLLGGFGKGEGGGLVEVSVSRTLCVCFSFPISLSLLDSAFVLILVPCLLEAERQLFR